MKTLNSKQRNISIVLVAVILILTTQGCQKFLDTQRQGEYYTDNYPYSGGSGPYDSSLFGAYNGLRSYGVHVAAFMLATSIRSDDADKGSTTTDGGADANSMDDFPVLPSNNFINGMWTDYYNLIIQCNTTLDQIENNKDIVASEEVKIQSEAEAKFLRAYAYFNMVRLFGNIPLIDKVLAVDESNVPQSNPATLYAFIEKDLQFAAANLPVSWDAKFIGRATKGAANGMLTKVYLTEQKWAMAMSTASLVMNSGQYDLSTSYDRIFREEGENSKESVFEIQATTSPKEQTANGLQYVEYQGVRGSGDWDLGFGWNMPSSYLEAAYEPGDPRKERTILYTVVNGSPGKTIYGETLPAGLPNPKYNNKVYSNPARRRTDGRHSWWMNLRALRYADVVLMYAEAANEVGGETNITNAVTALNTVRARARGTNSVLPDIVTTDQDVAREAIRHERRIELAMENDRFFDIVRWGISQTAMSNAGKINFNASRDNLLPIPQAQIDLSKGKLVQNSGY